MREYTSPSVADVTDGASINDLLATRVAAAGSGVLIERKAHLGDAWIAVTASQFQAQVTAVAKGLVAHGIAVGDRVAIMSDRKSVV